MRNDAISNLLGAITICGKIFFFFYFFWEKKIKGHFVIPEVCLYFREKLLRGNRTKKLDSSGFDAFDSPNFVPLATLGVTLNVRWELIL